MLDTEGDREQEVTAAFSLAGEDRPRGRNWTADRVTVPAARL